MSRGHHRKTCSGGSPVVPDPLVAEIAECVSVGRSVAAALREVSTTPTAAEPPERDELLAELDTQLDRLASDAGVRCAEDGASRNPAVLGLLRGVRLPTTHALSRASLEPLRTAILRISEEQDPHRWAAYHVFLGGALRLRAYRKGGHQRANFLIEATRAFDAAYCVYASMYSVFRSEYRLTGPLEHGPHPAAGGDRVASHRRGRYRPTGYCLGERDSALLIARVVVGSAWENGHLLERAVTSLRLARASADTQSWIWVSSTNNLACALTLLAKRTPTPAGAAMLREAASVLCEALKSPPRSMRREDRASTLVNLAEALLSMAERETPRMRLKKIERAFTASSVALLTVIPSDLAWLVRLEGRELV